MKFNHRTAKRYNHPRKPEAENDLLFEIRMGDVGDPYGLAVSYLFAIADYLTELGEHVPPEWDFRQSPLGPDTESFEWETLCELRTPPATALRVGQVLHRWITKLEIAGRTY